MIPVAVTCSNPDCSASFSSSAADLSAARCPHCGSRASGVTSASSSGGSRNPAGRSQPESHGPASTTPELADGSEFGRYRITRRLGRGGMGSVYLAHDTILDRPIALKIPALSDRDGPEGLERFYREARAAAALDHPNLCPVYDVGQVDGTPYLTMAFVEGRALSEVIGPEANLPQRQVAAVVRKLALALQAAHDQGVVHRDLKPANVIVSRRKEIVVVDFGLARRDGAGDARLTRSGVILGTPAYMAPEQVSGELEAVGPCSDIYAMGVILYEMLTGRLPFEGPVALVLGQVMMAQPEPPSQVRGGVEPALEAACLRALAKKPADRFASMAELADTLADYLRGGASEMAAGSLAEMPNPDVTSAPRATGGESLVGRFFERLVSRKSEVSLAGSQVAKPAAVPPPARPRRRRLVMAGAAAFLSLFLGIVIYVKTDEGTVRIELSDPKAEVAVKVDGKSIEVQGLGEPLKLRVGGHLLEIEGKDFASRSESFTIKRGDNPAVYISLVPRPKVPEPSAALKNDPKPREPIVPAPKSTTAPADYFETIGVAQGLIDQSKASEARSALAACRPEDRNWEWRYLSKLCAGAGAKGDGPGPPARFIAFDNPGRAESVTFSPDGREAAVGGNDERWSFGPLNFYQASTGRLLSSIANVWGSFVAYSADGALVAASGGGSVKVWKTATHELVADLKGEGAEKYIFTVPAISPDGRLVAAGDQAKFGVRVWSVGDGKLLHSWPDHTNKCWVVAFTPDGKRLVSYGADGLVRTREVHSGDEVGFFRLGDVIQEVIGNLSADARWVAAIVEDRITVWDVATGKSVVTLAGAGARSASFSPDGSRLVTGGQDGQIKLWDTRTGRLALTLRDQGPVNWTSSACFSPDGRRLASWAGGGEYITTARIYDAGDAFPEAPEQSQGGVTTAPATLAYGDRIAGIRQGVRDRRWAEVDRLLDACPHDQRGWEWAYLDHLARPELTVRPSLTIEHPTVVSTVAFHPAGTSIASAFAWSRTIHISDAKTGKALLDIPTRQKNEVWSLTYSPDGRQIVAGSYEHGGWTEGTYAVFDTSTGKPIRTIKGSLDLINGARFSFDGRYILGKASENRVVVFNAATGQELRIIGGEGSSMAGGWNLGQEERTIVFGSKDDPQTIRTINLDDGAEVRRFRVNPGDGVAGYFDNNRRFLTLNGTIHTVWDPSDGREVVRFDPSPPDLNRSQVLPGARWFVGGTRDGHLHFWSIATGRHLHSFLAHSEPSWALSCTKDGRRIASASFDKTTKIWEVSGGPEADMTLSDHDGPVTSLAFDPSGKCLASASADRTVKIWDATTGKLLRAVEGHSGRDAGKSRAQVLGVAYSPDGTLIASTDVGRVRVWDSLTGKSKAELPLDGASELTARHVGFAPDGRQLLAAGDDGTVFRWGTKDWKGLPAYHSDSKGAVFSLAIGPGGRQVYAAGPDALVRSWDAESGKEIPPLTGHSDAVHSIAIDPNGGRLASASSDGSVRVFGLAGGQLLWAQNAHAGGAEKVVYSPDGRRLASSGADGMVRLRDAADGVELLALAMPSGKPTNGLAFSPDGSRLAAGDSSGGIHVWNSNRTIPQAPDSLSVAVQPKGKKGSITPPNRRNRSHVFLSDLKEAESLVNVGVLGKNGDLGYNPGHGADRRVMISGEHSEKALSMHARSSSDGSAFARYDLRGQFSSFNARAAVNDSVKVVEWTKGKTQTPLTFSVVGDNRVLWTSRPLQQAGEFQACSIDISGVRSLELRVGCAGAAGAAHAVWGDPSVE